MGIENFSIYGKIAKLHKSDSHVTINYDGVTLSKTETRHDCGEQVLILDEPTAHMDHHSKTIIWNLLKVSMHYSGTGLPHANPSILFIVPL
jgi:hypothetical protein